MYAYYVLYCVLYLFVPIYMYIRLRVSLPISLFAPSTAASILPLTLRNIPFCHLPWSRFLYFLQGVNRFANFFCVIIFFYACHLISYHLVIKLYFWVRKNDYMFKSMQKSHAHMHKKEIEVTRSTPCEEYHGDYIILHERTTKGVLTSSTLRRVHWSFDPCNCKSLT